MAHIDLNDLPDDMNAIRRAVRQSAHAQRIRLMLAAAGLATLGMVSVAGAMLANIF